MNRTRMFFTVGATLMALFVLGTTRPAAADPTGTAFLFSATNFQGDTLGDVVPFGVPTLTGSGMIIDSHVTPVPTGGEFIDIWFSTENGAYLAGSPVAESQFLIQGINWGPDSPPAVAVGLLYISFDISGQFVDLNEANGAFPILPHPITGQDSIVLDVDGEPADVIPFAVGFPLSVALNTVMTDPTLIPTVNSMHVGYQVHHVPEPASMTLLMGGLAGLCLVCRRRAR